MNLILFTGPDCHLCQLAKEQLAAISDVHVITQNVREDTNLYHRYAMQIPVLKREDTNQELNWPFCENDIRSFIQ